MIEPPEPEAPGSPDQEPLDEPPVRRLELMGKISTVLMYVGGASLVAVFVLFLLVMAGKLTDFPYHYLGIGAFVVYATGRVLGFIRRSMLKSDEE